MSDSFWTPGFMGNGPSWRGSAQHSREMDLGALTNATNLANAQVAVDQQRALAIPAATALAQRSQEETERAGLSDRNNRSQLTSLATRPQMSINLGGMTNPNYMPSPFGAGMSVFDRMYPGARRFARGTTRVPGQGDGTVDTQPALLAPGESVLNRAAADTLGRGLIAALNSAGRQKMGMV